jgi:hypothetical protein
VSLNLSTSGSDTLLVCYECGPALPEEKVVKSSYLQSSQQHPWVDVAGNLRKDTGHVNLLILVSHFVFSLDPGIATQVPKHVYQKSQIPRDIPLRSIPFCPSSHHFQRAPFKAPSYCGPRLGGVSSPGNHALKRSIAMSTSWN